MVLTTAGLEAAVLVTARALRVVHVHTTSAAPPTARAGQLAAVVVFVLLVVAVAVDWVPAHLRRTGGGVSLKGAQPASDPTVCEHDIRVYNLAAAWIDR